MEMNARIAAFRSWMASQNLDGFIVPSADPHQSEYVAERYKGRAWLSGFAGSAGTLVVLKDKAALWTDSRYWLEAEMALKGTGIELMYQGRSDCPSWGKWIATVLGNGPARLGLDGMVHTVGSVRTLVADLDRPGIEVVDAGDPFRQIWDDRPGMPRKPIVPFESPEGDDATVVSRLDSLSRWMEERGIDWYLVGALDELAWLLDLRGSDVPCNPVYYGWFLYNRYSSTLFVPAETLTPEVHGALEVMAIQIAPYESLTAVLEELPSQDRILVALDQMPWAVHGHVAHMRTLETTPALPLMKARKSAAVLKALGEAHRTDGAVLVELHAWIRDQHRAGAALTEDQVALKLIALRNVIPSYRGESFDAIVGFRENGAIVHYRPEEGKSAAIEGRGLLLIDSGAQFLNGTTDATRTLCLGTPTDEERLAYTLVLKGHIALSRAVFPRGSSGQQLDILARQALWNQGMDYGHGTGHGVGFYLNVHEGPQRIAPQGSSVPLEPGMVLSNEPGYYRSGAFGIRIENLVAVEEHPDLAGFLRFHTLTLAPYEPDLIDASLLDSTERFWLEDYGRRVREALEPLLSSRGREEVVRRTAWPWGEGKAHGA